MRCAQAFFSSEVESENWLLGSLSKTTHETSRLTTKEWPMLVLSRKKNESIVINNDITIVVVEIRGDKVRLGVEAPKEVPVHRREVYDAIKKNEQLAKEGDSASEAGK
jgi:carbon storage regulator